MTILVNTPEYSRLPDKDKFRLCNLGAKRIKGKLMVSYKNIKCNMWMSEVKYSPKPKHTYSIIRNPRELVLSQYFHCSESKDHAKFSYRMPSLDVWLESWVSALTNTSKAEKCDKLFHCYDPRNMQSMYVDFHPENKYHTLDDIQRKFTVIAPMEQMDASICVIFIHYTGWVPEVCDCTFPHSNHHDDETIRRADHGVKHHGASYNTTKHQDELIHQLVETDHLIHEYTKQLFARQLLLTQEKFNITICSKIKHQG